METLSLDQKMAIVGLVLAVVGIVLGLGVALGMDTRSKGEVYFSISCFVLSAIAVSGVVGIWAYISTASLLSKITTAALSGGLTMALLVLGITWVGERHRYSINGATVAEPKSPFNVVIEGRLFSESFDKSGFFWILRGVPQSIAPIGALIALRIVNNQTTASMLSQLSAEGNTTDGKWIRLLRIDSRTVQLFSLGTGDPRKALLLTPVMLDEMVENRAVGPKETVKGWLIFVYPRGAQTFNGKFRFTIVDTLGARYVQELPDTNAGDFGGNNLPSPGGYQDISKYPTILYQDLPGFWINP